MKKKGEQLIIIISLNKMSFMAFIWQPVTNPIVKQITHWFILLYMIN